MKIPSSYLQYNIERLKELCEIQIVQNGYFWNTISDCEPTPFLVELLDRTAAIPKKSAKSTAECIVAPILVEMWKQNKRFIPLSGLQFTVDTKRGLRGVTDFLISSKANTHDLSDLMLCVFTAKNDAIEHWYGQCGAEMYAARLFNEKKAITLQLFMGQLPMVLHGYF